MKTKRLLLLAVLAMMAFTLSLAQSVSFSFTRESASSMSSTLRNNMERNISRLLTEINNAQKGNRSLSLSGCNVDATAQRRLNMLWQDMHFYCEDNLITARLLEDAQGYQIRDIAINMVPVGSGYNGDTARDCVISFNRSGVITSITPATEQTSFTDVMNNGKNVEDVRRRREIIKFVEEYFGYYEAKDINAIEDIFSDNALIITGCVVKTEKAGDMVRAEAQVRYKRQNKSQYIDNLRKSFLKNKYIKIDIEDIKVNRSGSKPQFYGVTLRQKYYSDTYSDDGYVFLLWDFTNEIKPKIHVRTWQPSQFINPSNEVFNIHDFMF